MRRPLLRAIRRCTTKTSAPAEAILLMHNLQSRSNKGDMLRTAAAFGVGEIVWVGDTKVGTLGSHGVENFLRFSHFRKFDEAVAYLRTVRRASICGCEIAEEAQPVWSQPFRGTTAFLMGNEGRGLSSQQLEACDHLVYIPQYSGATASLNVNAACAIVLHHFAEWSGMAESPRDSFNPAKFEVGTPGCIVPRSGVGLNQAKTLRADGTVEGRMRTGDSRSAVR